LKAEAHARGSLAVSIFDLSADLQRSLDLVRQAVALMRRAVRTAAPGKEVMEVKLTLASWLNNLGNMLNSISQGRMRMSFPNSMVEAEACFREALELSKESNDVSLMQTVLANLANMSYQSGQTVGPTEAATLRARLNTLYAQTGREPDTTCTICLELLESIEQPGGGADGAVGDGFRGSDDSTVQVLKCGHQFHYGCISTWWRTTSNTVCPICKKW